MRSAPRFPGGSRGSVALLCLLLTSLCAAAESAAQVGEQLEVRLVTIPLTVIDETGRTVQGLEADQIELRRDDELTEVVSLSSTSPAAGVGGPGPASFVLYVDTAFVEPGALASAAPALTRFVREGLPPGTRIAVIEADREKVRLLGGPTDPDDAAALLAGLDPRPGSTPSLLEAREIEREMERALGGGGRRVLTVRDALPDLLLERISSLGESTADEVAARMANLRWAVRAVSGLPGPVDLLYVGGVPPAGIAARLYSRWLAAFGPNSAYADTGSADSEGTGAGSSRGEAGFSTGATAFSALAAPTPVVDPGALLDPLISQALVEGVRIHTLALDTVSPGTEGLRSSSGGVIGPGASATGPALDQGAASGPAAAGLLRNLARSTSGVALSSRSGVAEELASLSERLAGGYLLTFADTDAEPGGRHRLELSLPGAPAQIDLRHPTSYLTRSLDQIAAARVLTALRLRHTDNPLGFSASATAGRAGDEETVEISLAIPAARLALATERRAHTGRISIFVAAGGWETATEVRKAVLPLRIHHEDLLTALGRQVEYTVSIQRPASGDRVSVAVRDDLALLTSTLVVALPPATGLGESGP